MQLAWQRNPTSLPVLLYRRISNLYKRGCTLEICILLANVNSIVIPDKVQKGVGLVKLSIASTELQNNHSLLKKLIKVNIAGDREYRIIQQAIAIT